MFCLKRGNEAPERSGFCGNCSDPVDRSSVQDAGSTSFVETTSNRALVAAAVDMKKRLSPLAIAIAIVAVIAVAGVMGGCSSSSTDSGTGSTSSSGTTGASSVSSVSSKDSVEDYTWAELSAISAEIAAASDEDEAIEIAQTYNLVNEDGTLDGTQTKSVTLSDGTVTSVQIAGFLHDDKSDGSGKAGITFIFADNIAENSMNSDHDNSGGWESSDMRSWLASEGMDLLPEELQDVIVAVDKLTNNVGETEDISSVTTTSDELWLFSWIELAGEIDESYYLDGYEYITNIVNAEGSQYQLFSDCGVELDVSNDILAKESYGMAWWGRSPSPYDSRYFLNVNTGGVPAIGDLAGHSYGVAPGFCI